MNRRNMCGGLMLSFAAAYADARAAEARSEGPPRRRGPALEVATTDGKVMKVHEQKGKVVLVDFMTTTCPTCKVASADIQKVYQDLGSKGFSPVAVALDVGAPFMLFGYKQQLGLTFPIGVASREVVTGYLQHPAAKPLLVPTLVLLDRQGRIVSKYVGWRSEGELRAAVLQLLAE